MQSFFNYEVLDLKVQIFKCGIKKFQTFWKRKVGFTKVQSL